VSLVYAADLELFERGTASPALLPVVAAVVGRWAGVTDLEPGEHEGIRGPLTVERFGPGGEGGPSGAVPEVWRLSLSHPDSADPAYRWRASVTVLAGASTEAQVRLERFRDSGVLRPARSAPRPPRCVEHLVEAPGLEARDGGRALSRDVWVVDEAGSADFASFLLSAERRLPVVAVTQRDENVVDGGTLQEELLGLAHVALVKTGATWALDELLPQGLNAYGGAVRLWWPGLAPGADPWAHPLWPERVSAEAVRREVVRRVSEAALAVPLADPRVVALVREARAGQLRAAMAAASSQADADVAERDAALAALALELENQNAELAEAWEMAAEEEAKAKEAGARAARLQGERDHWREEFRKLAAARSAAGLASDVDSLLRFGIEQAVEAMNLDGARPRSFTVGARFVPTLESLGVDRDKVLRAAADVVAAAPARLAARGDHPQRAGPGAAARPRVRQRDGATAHRLYVEQNTPSARRLHYWVLPDGSVELASVNLHDDMTIPD
jgi:hypothetical protein